MGYDASFDRLPTQALFDLKGPRTRLDAWAGAHLPAFPSMPNRATHGDGAWLCHVGPDHWILRADPTREAGLEAALRPAKAPPEISVVTVSDTLAFFRITGRQASEVLSVGCPLDLHPSQFPEDAASHTEFFTLRTLVMRVEGGFDVAVDQSHGDLVADYLAGILA